MDKLYVTCDSQLCLTAASPENPKALWHFDSESFSFSITCKFQHMFCVHTKCFCRQFIWAHRWTTMWCSNMENRGEKKKSIKNIIFVILDLSCSGGRRSTQIIKPTTSHKNENSIIFLTHLHVDRELHSAYNHLHVSVSKWFMLTKSFGLGPVDCLSWLR